MCNTKSTAYVLELVGQTNGYYAAGNRTTKNLAAAKFYIGSHSARQSAYQMANRMQLENAKQKQLEKIIIHKVEVQIING